jgi:histone deacetylase 8
VVTAVAAVFRPTAVVVQCGCDGLADDPVARDGLTLTTRGFGAVVRRLVEHFRRERLPVLLLGGGGYDPANAARCWSILTAVALGVEALPRQVPDHALLMHYAPAFELHSSAPPPTAARDGNDKAYLQRLIAFVKRFCELARSDTRQAQVGGADKGHAGDQPPSSGEKATALSARPQEEPLEGERE